MPARTSGASGGSCVAAALELQGGECAQLSDGLEGLGGGVWRFSLECEFWCMTAGPRAGTAHGMPGMPPPRHPPPAAAGHRNPNPSAPFLGQSLGSLPFSNFGSMPSKKRQREEVRSRLQSSNLGASRYEEFDLTADDDDDAHSPTARARTVPPLPDEEPHEPPWRARCAHGGSVLNAVSVSVSPARVLA